MSPFLCPPNAASLLASQEEDAATPKSTPPVAAAAASSATAGVHTEGSPVRHIDEYPQAVQELVMNGFELRRVIHAYELLGDNFDDLLAFLMSRVAS
jgi:predicted cation transporter